MEPIIELLKLAIVGLIAGVFSSLLSNRDHRYKKWWELRVTAYQSLIDALSDLVHYYDKNYAATMEHRELSEEHRKKLREYWDDAFPKVRKASDSGAFLFSEEINKALTEFIKCHNDYYDAHYEYLDSMLPEARKCLSTVVNASKTDLMVKKPWL